MISLIPSWMETWTVQQAETELQGFQFQGPGIYQKKGDSVLVIPKDRPIKELWNPDYHHPRGEELFEFYFYNNARIVDIIATLAHCPIWENK